MAVEFPGLLEEEIKTLYFLRLGKKHQIFLLHLIAKRPLARKKGYIQLELD